MEGNLGLLLNPRMSRVYKAYPHIGQNQGLLGFWGGGRSGLLVCASGELGACEELGACVCLGFRVWGVGFKSLGACVALRLQWLKTLGPNRWEPRMSPGFASINYASNTEYAAIEDQVSW